MQKERAAAATTGIVEQAIARERHALFAVIAVCGYTCLSLSQTNQQEFLLPTITKRISFISESLPLPSFFLVAPLIVGLNHAYLIYCVRDTIQKISSFNQQSNSNYDSTPKLNSANLPPLLRFDWQRHFSLLRNTAKNKKDLLGGVLYVLLDLSLYYAIPTGTLLFATIKFLPARILEVFVFHWIILLFSSIITFIYLMLISHLLREDFRRRLKTIRIGKFSHKKHTGSRFRQVLISPIKKIAWFAPILLFSIFSVSLLSLLPVAYASPNQLGPLIMQYCILDLSDEILVQNPEKLPKLNTRDIPLTSTRLNDVIGLDLEYRDLRFANFKNTNLTNAQLSHAYLNGATFQDAILEGAWLNDASVEGVNFEGTVLTAAMFQRSSLIGSNFKGAFLPGADFLQAKAQAADFAGATMKCVVLSLANLSSARLNNASLDGSDIYGAIMFGTDITDASFRFANLEMVLHGNTLRHKVSPTTPSEFCINAEFNNPNSPFYKADIAFKTLFSQNEVNDEVNNEYSRIASRLSALPDGPLKHNAMRLFNTARRNPPARDMRNLKFTGNIQHLPCNYFEDIVREIDKFSPRESPELYGLILRINWFLPLQVKLNNREPKNELQTAAAIVLKKAQDSHEWFTIGQTERLAGYANRSIEPYLLQP